MSKIMKRKGISNIVEEFEVLETILANDLLTRSGFKIPEGEDLFLARISYTTKNTAKNAKGEFLPANSKETTKYGPTMKLCTTSDLENYLNKGIEIPTLRKDGVQFALLDNQIALEIKETRSFNSLGNNWDKIPEFSPYDSLNLDSKKFAQDFLDKSSLVLFHMQSYDVFGIEFADGDLISAPKTITLSSEIFDLKLCVEKLKDNPKVKFFIKDNKTYMSKHRLVDSSEDLETLLKSIETVPHYNQNDEFNLKEIRILFSPSLEESKIRILESDLDKDYDSKWAGKASTLNNDTREITDNNKYIYLNGEQMIAVHLLNLHDAHYEIKAAMMNNQAKKNLHTK